MVKKKVAKEKKTIGEANTDKHAGVESIAETLRAIKTKFGDDSIMTLNESKRVDVDGAADRCGSRAVNVGRDS